MQATGLVVLEVAMESGPSMVRQMVRQMAQQSEMTTAPPMVHV